jgi:hypothetical protein
MKWFQHETNANRDPKLEKLLLKYGADGYALYFLCLELIAAPIDRTHINFDLEHDSEYLAARLHIDSRRVEEIMRYMIDLELFEFDQSSMKITCMHLALRLENSIVKNAELARVKKKVAAKLTRYKEKKQALKKANPGWSGMIPDSPGKFRTDIELDVIEPTSANVFQKTEKNGAKNIAPGDSDIEQSIQAIEKQWSEESELMEQQEAARKRANKKRGVS